MSARNFGYISLWATVLSRIRFKTRRIGSPSPLLPFSGHLALILVGILRLHL
jgi:hypothetical protein